MWGFIFPLSPNLCNKRYARSNLKEFPFADWARVLFVYLPLESQIGPTAMLPSSHVGLLIWKMQLGKHKASSSINEPKSQYCG